MKPQTHCVPSLPGYFPSHLEHEASLRRNFGHLSSFSHLNPLKPFAGETRGCNAITLRDHHHHRGGYLKPAETGTAHDAPALQRHWSVLQRTSEQQTSCYFKPKTREG